ncbi:pectin acetylesterase 8-like [Ipomoea triloba]|uniref:pectin acetylesterase 8-like n=1 Tax=Ipomoea triloba TaxID=35885 RepID=UPI00125CDF6D|nr:pectin acetylesterase 8-like [Ipomoea triloba]
METKLILLVFFFVFQLRTSNGLYVNPTLLRPDTGAVCLTGKPASYYFLEGFGKGIHNWLVYLPGGGWCATPGDCIKYANDKNITIDPVPYYFGTILGNNKEKNPDFFDWNKVVITYCDGSSFTGNSQTIYNGTNLYFKGARIFNVVMQELLQKGMGMAQNESTKSLPKTCTSRLSPHMCFFAHNVQQDIQTPIFFLMSAFDIFQVSSTFIHNETIQNCIVNETACSSEIYKVLQDLRLELLSLLPNQSNSSSKGVLITSPKAHGQIQSANWYLDMVIEGSNETIAKLFRDWYFDNRDVHIIDKYPYPYSKNFSTVPNNSLT